jgi:hypothetical protein
MAAALRETAYLFRVLQGNFKVLTDGSPAMAGCLRRT